MDRAARLAHGSVVLAVVLAAALLVVLLVGEGARDESAGRHADGGAPAARDKSTDGSDGRKTDTSPVDAQLVGTGVSPRVAAPTDVTVRLVGPGGEELAGVVLVARRGGGTPAEKIVTGADGRAVVPRVSLDGSVSLAARHPPFEWGPLKAEDEEDLGVLRAPAMDVTLTWGTPIGLDVRDADTGLSMPGIRWRLRLRQSGYASPWAVTGVTKLTLPVHPSTLAVVRFDVEAPPGYVAWDESAVWVPTSRLVREIRVVYPLRKEAAVALDVTGSTDGSAIAPVVIGWHVPLDSPHWTWVVPDVLGRLRVRGLPSLPGAPLHLLVGDLTLAPSYPMNPGFSGAKTATRLPGTTLVRTVLPAAGEEGLVRTELPPLPARSNGPSYGTQGETSTEWVPPPPLQDWVHDAPGNSEVGRVVVEVRDPSGRVCSGVRIAVYGNKWYWSGHSDVEGFVDLDDRPVGAGRVFLADRVWFPAREPFEVRAGKTTRVTLKAPVGGQLRVRVVDADGLPRPFAQVRALLRDAGATKDSAWWLLEDGVLEGDAFTDVRGEKCFRRLPAGRCWITALRSAPSAWGTPLGWGDPSRQQGPEARATCEIREGETTEVTLVCPP